MTRTYEITLREIGSNPPRLGINGENGAVTVRRGVTFTTTDQKVADYARRNPAKFNLVDMTPTAPPVKPVAAAVEESAPQEVQASAETVAPEPAPDVTELWLRACSGKQTVKDVQKFALEHCGGLVIPAGTVKEAVDAVENWLIDNGYAEEA